MRKFFILVFVIASTSIACDRSSEAFSLSRYVGTESKYWRGSIRAGTIGFSIGLKGYMLHEIQFQEQT